MGHSPGEDTHSAGEYTVLSAAVIFIGYFILICICVTVGPRRILKCLLVSDATVPDDIPILNWFGWGLGAGPLLTHVLVALCNLPYSDSDEEDEETA